MSDFHDDLLKGNIFKEIVRVLLQKSDYTVIPYGYENPFANIRKALIQCDSETARRIRSSPDLLVYSDVERDVKLVEVKMSSHALPQLNRKGLIGTYQKYWNDAIMVLVLPFDNVFYAQKIADLGKKEQYDPKTDFSARANNWDGICLGSSSNNTLSGNNVANNRDGIVLYYPSDNNIFVHNSFVHNGFLNNTSQVIGGFTKSIWDAGFPLGGNYWSDYDGTDADHDGIGDTAYIIDPFNTDNYPLMGMFSEFNVTYFTPPLVSHACDVTVISNSSVSDFVAPIWIELPEVIFLKFNVTGAAGSTGFCRVSFPTAMMNSTCHVFVSGIEVPCILLPCSNADYSYLYFTYTHSTKEVVIIPEFESFLILSFFFTVTLFAVIIYRRKRRWFLSKHTKKELRINI